MMKKITDETGIFLAEYASLLWGSGATCTRIEKNIGRMAHALNLDADIEIMPGHVQVVLPDGSVIVRKNTQVRYQFRYKRQAEPFELGACRRENRVHRGSTNVQTYCENTSDQCPRGACPHIIGQRIFLSAVRGRYCSDADSVCRYFGRL